jgi:hypothetical protein
VPEVRDGNTHVYAQYTIRLPNREQAGERLKVLLRRVIANALAKLPDVGGRDRRSEAQARRVDDGRLAPKVRERGLAATYRVLPGHVVKRDLTQLLDYRDTAMTLGHRRLAIIDPAGGVQPMADESGRYQLAYNGEVYNYIEVREGLEREWNDVREDEITAPARAGSRLRGRLRAFNEAQFPA